MRRILNSMPYNEITNMKTIPRKTFVFIAAKISNALVSLLAKIWVAIASTTTKPTKRYHVKMSAADVSIKNHRENPAVTVSALKR